MEISQQPKICVVIRKRPLNKKQQQRNQTDIISVKNAGTLIVSEYKQKLDLTKYIEESVFNFDYVFNDSSQNEQIYIKTVRPLVQSAFQGAKVICFAYGQTGSGKTYTMNGDYDHGVAGLYTLGAEDIFNLLHQSTTKYQIYVSFFEIYCGKLFDLLNNRNELVLREDNKQNVNIVGIQQLELFSPEQFMRTIDHGSKLRVTSQNSTNADSSRSHAILQISLKQGKKLFGKISFIDLAGCQRGADHMDQHKQTRIDGAEINKSLLALKECIRALDQGKGHTPFRGSKLTMVLKDSFVGFCKTVMIGNVSPGLLSCENTLNTLRYADRVKQLKKKTSREQMSKWDQLAKDLMLPRMNKNTVKINIEKDDKDSNIYIKKIQAKRKILGIKNIGNNDENVHQNKFKGSQYTFGRQPSPVNRQRQENNENIRTESQTARSPVTNNIGSIKLRNNQVSLKNINTKFTSTAVSGLQSSSSGKQNNFSKTFLTKTSVPQIKNLGYSCGFTKNDQNYQNSALFKTISLSKADFSQLNYKTFENGRQLNNNIVVQQNQNILSYNQDQNWKDRVKLIRESHLNTQSQIDHAKTSYSQLTKNIINQEDVLKEQHSLTINREIDVIKRQIKVISQIKNNKNIIESIEFADELSDMIDQKLEILLHFKKNCQNFKSKLFEHQECGRKMLAAKQLFNEELLLDD